MFSFSSVARKAYFRLKGRRWWHNRIYPKDFVVTHLPEGLVRLSYRERTVDVRSAQVLQGAFADQEAHLILSGPSIRDITSVDTLAQRFSIMVNGSPALYIKHGLTYDAYVADDPHFVAQRSEDVVHYARRARFCFFSYRTMLILLRAKMDLSGLHIYIFDYKYMPFRRRRDEEIGLFLLGIFNRVWSCAIRLRIWLCKSLIVWVLHKWLCLAWIYLWLGASMLRIECSRNF